MNAHESQLFAAHITRLNQRTETLYRNAQDIPWQQPQLVLDCLEELRISLEELRVAEEELREQNEELMAARTTIEIERQRYQDLFEFAPDGYVVTDLQGTVREVNRAASQLLNISQDRLVGKPIDSYATDESRGSFRSVLSQLPTLNRVQEWEVQLCARGGACFEAALTVETVRDETGVPIALRWLLRDITARKAAEAKLYQVQLQNLELAEANRLKSQFLAMMSHELRTPMNAILGFSDLLLRRFHQHDPQLTSMVERIFRNGRHLLSIIEEILDFSKLQSCHLDLQSEPFDLAQLATDITNELRSLTEQKLLDLQLRLAQPHIPVMNDSQRLRQVITNLLSNAIKFTDSGSVALEVWELPEGRIAIVVRDTGIGIDPQDQTHIFQEFWQVNQTASRSYNGTGLGLAITRSLVQLMGGSVSVESQLGQGTIFRVEIPRYVS